MSIPTNRLRQKRIRVVLAKSDMGAHDRGIGYIAQVLRDAGDVLSPCYGPGFRTAQPVALVI